MLEITKLMNKTNSSYRELGSGDAKNTDLFFDREHRDFFGDSETVTVRLTKQNITQAFLFIASMLPKKFDSSSVHENRYYSEAFVADGFKRINAVFDNSPYRDFIWTIRKDVEKKNGELDERLYLNGLISDYTYTDEDGTIIPFKFTIRDYLLGGYSTLKLTRESLDSIINLLVENSGTPIIKNEEPSNQHFTEDGMLYIPGIAAQKIFYGCPGTGKSYKVKDIAEGIKDAAHPEDGWKTIWYQPATKEDKTCSKVENPSDDDKKKLTTNIFRTTFHPDYDYATFVGCYKPVKEGGSLDYKFVPQVFTNAYVCALRHPEDPIYLIIEEINRGNCAQIFGDLFQLLDRTNGESDYSIEPDTELAKYLKSEEVDSERLSLPSNLHIYATMNTSDQSLFPMDSAFKRRWEMEYIPINYEQEKASKFLIKIGSSLYSWTRFITVVNELIIDATGSEDKQLGEFFVKARDAKEGENKEYKYIDTDLFINKVMFFIWNDVCKDYYNPRHTGSQFFMRIAGAEGTEKDIFTFADLYSPRNVGNTLILRFMSYLENTYMKTHKDLKAEYIDKGKPWLMIDPIKVETTAAPAE